MQRERDENRLFTLNEEGTLRREHILDQNRYSCPFISFSEMGSAGANVIGSARVSSVT